MRNDFIRCVVSFPISFDPRNRYDRKKGVFDFGEYSSKLLNQILPMTTEKKNQCATNTFDSGIK